MDAREMCSTFMVAPEKSQRNARRSLEPLVPLIDWGPHLMPASNDERLRNSNQNYERFLQSGFPSQPQSSCIGATPLLPQNAKQLSRFNVSGLARARKHVAL